MGFDRRIGILAACATVPGVVTTLVLLWILDLSTASRVAIGVTVVATTLLLIETLRARISYPLRTLANIIGALREDDYALRARGGMADDAMGELTSEVNMLADMLRERRLDQFEAAALVRGIVAQLDSAIFAFDRSGRLQLINRAGERLLARFDAVGHTIDELGLRDCFATSLPSAVEMTFPGGTGRWSVRRTTFREKGKSHDLLVISDLSRPLRDEELLAWQRLVRVISHELNNSLAPITSIAASLQRIIDSEPLPSDWRDDAKSGLGVISSRAEALTRFTQAYARLARLPRPVLASVEIGKVVRRVAALEFAVPVRVESGPPVIVTADADQLEQALINLLQNGVDASKETKGSVTVTWSQRDGAVEISVLDEGLGLSGSRNLFVPFFTTKPGGTGIGLVLSRQIAEAHDGHLSLQTRSEGSGCEARLTIPLRGPERALSQAPPPAGA